MDADWAIIGGGVVGLAVAYGLIRRGHRVLVLDGSDTDFRASRGNFGLIWVQSKGLNQPDYARWTRGSAALWKDFASELSDTSGAELSLQQRGGYEFFLDEAAMEAQARRYEGLKVALGGDYPFEVLGHNALKREEPAIGPRVAGALFHREDGHVNPLILLRTLTSEVRRRGGTVVNGVTIVDAEAVDGFALRSDDGRSFRAGRVVMAAGLGAASLGPKLGFRAPVRPQRGQVLITERMPRLLNRPSGVLRQVNEGGIQIGASNEEVGLNDGTTLDVTARIAADAIEILPDLARARVVRSWGALRVMSPDGLPIYQESASMPGAFLVTCHSGITLAAAHALRLPDWLEGRAGAPDLEVFRETRFS